LSRAAHWSQAVPGWTICGSWRKPLRLILRPGGWLLLEHGFEQGRAVRQLLVDAGFVEVATRCDLAGLERITGACRPVRD